MRILQLIDTLNPGGAERMAVNYANSLTDFGHESFLVTTREEGSFKKLLSSKVNYEYIRKEKSLDLKALKKLNKYVRINNIDIIHAHGTSWFFAVLGRLSGSKTKIIWHNHYGDSENTPFYNLGLMKLFSSYFDGIISVNQRLKEWADHNLKCRSSISLLNFVVFPEVEEPINKDCNSVVCLANLKPVKNHQILLKACDNLMEEFNIRLHLIGNDLNDDYSSKLKAEFQKRPYVKFYDHVDDPAPILNKMNVGVLSSDSEGLPLALLEYGVAGLSIVCTDVGACRDIINGHGELVLPGDHKGLAKSIKEYLMNKEKSEADSLNFKKRVAEEYSAKKVIPLYLEFCFNL